MKLIFRWLINAATLIILAHYLPGIVVAGWYAALIAALVLGLVNALIRPIFILLTLPINILTLGLFTFVINGLLFWFVGTLVKGFFVAGFWPAFFGSFILTLVSWLTSSVLRNE